MVCVPNFIAVNENEASSPLLASADLSRTIVAVDSP